MKITECRYLQIVAGVRYWEDATINGIEDTDGDLVPLREDGLWMPTIDLQTGQILNWPEGTTAQIHYKVCDQGKYWLGDSDGKKIFRWKGYYVPDDLLCHTDQGFGDYIIFHVDGNGMIEDFSIPELDRVDWKRVS